MGRADDEKPDLNEIADRLEDIRAAIEELIDEASELIESSGRPTLIGGWNAYAKPSLMMALNQETEWLGSCSYNLEKVVEYLREPLDDDEEEAY